ncbi:MAG: NADH:flavin oxidoreductase [Mycobacteriaceae bacterium]|nr:NADH:flavin oxidoreductase [Mycobacteriaceae bacterium]
MDPVFSPVRLGPATVRNRIVKAATFEAATPGGVVTDRLVEFHRRHAEGGVGMTTVAFCAVSPEGRTDRDAMWLHPEVAAGLRTVTDAVHEAGAAASVQLGHAGPVANARSNQLPALGPGRFFNPLGMRRTRFATEADLTRVTAAYGTAALLAADAGFDAVELHFGHNYLISAFLSPLLNRRDDRYGGPLHNRARLALEVARTVREAVGDRIAVTAKLNMDDRVRGGFGIEESVQVAAWLQEAGTVDALKLTAGSSLLNPMAIFTGDAPVREFAAAFPKPAGWGLRVSGRAFLREYPFREAYLLDRARRFRAELSLPLILLGGVTSKSTMDTALAEGFDLVAMARALLIEPDLPARLRADPTVQSRCTHCNLCVPTIYTRTHCPVTA